MSKHAEQALVRLEKLSKAALKKQTQDGFAKLFTVLSCKGVGKEIKAGRNVVGNVKYGLRLCVHEKLGPRVNVETGKVTPQSKKAKQMEDRFLKLANKLLEAGGFKTVSKSFISDLRSKDKAWIAKVKKRKF